MRKISSAEEAADKERKRVRWMSFFLLGILIVSSLGYAFLSNPNIDDGSPLNATTPDVEGKWKLETAQGQVLLFANSPENVSDIEVSLAENFTFAQLAQDIVYIDSDNEQVNYEIASTVGMYLQKIQPACYGPCVEDLPEKDCNSSIIVWKESDTQRVYMENRCIFIEGDERAVDAFLFKLIGVN